MDNGLTDRILQRFVPRLTAEELLDLQHLVVKAVQESRHYSGKGKILEVIKDDQISSTHKTLAILVSNAWRKVSQDADTLDRVQNLKGLVAIRERLANAVQLITDQKSDCDSDRDNCETESLDTRDNAIRKIYEITVGRTPVLEEIKFWSDKFDAGMPFHEFFLLMEGGEEANEYKKKQSVLLGECDGRFIQTAFELVLARGAAAWEIDDWLRRMEEAALTRSQVLAQLFETARKFFDDQKNAIPHDGLSCSIMGTGRTVTIEDWKRRETQSSSASKHSFMHFRKHFKVTGKPRVLVSALSSMYCGGDFIEQFMDNITSQDCFNEYCELIIVDADSPEKEYETIKRYLDKHKNINYIRCNYRVGIYDAWNMAAKVAQGKYLTNANLDDLRRNDSFMMQAAVLENLPFVDVVYQDLYYTFNPNLSFEQIAACDLRTTLPVISPHNMIKFNSPHNAPMWRSKLHQELGFFDTDYKSAGDYEFWLRCLTAGKKFYKINDPHVAYYQNPKGLSTRPDTRGVIEGIRLHKEYCRKLIQEDALIPQKEFLQRLGPVAPVVDGDSRDRYNLVQQALRNAARYKKYTVNEALGQ